MADAYLIYELPTRDEDETAYVTYGGDVDDAWTPCDITSFEAVMQATKRDFSFRRWQRPAIERALRALDEPGGAALVEAGVGTGKTLVAQACAYCAIAQRSAYNAKVLMLCPLVKLAREQYATICNFVDAQTDVEHLEGRYVPVVALRAGDTSEGVLGEAHYVVATYEFGRQILAQAALRIYPHGPLKHTYADAIRLVVIDEIHNLASDRGVIISAIIGLCRAYDIPVLMMSGTTHERVRAALDACYGAKLCVLSSDGDARCLQIPVRFDDDKALVDLVLTSVVDNLLKGRSDSGWLFFVRTIHEVYPMFQGLCTAVRAKLEAAAKHGLPTARQLLARVDAAVDGHTLVPDDLVVSRSGSVAYGETLPTLAALPQVVANERRNALVGWELGLAYNWRGLGDWYASESLERLARGTVQLIVTTSTLATGVNIMGVRHVVVWSPRFTAPDLAQMIGRCGRWGIGYAFLRAVDAPSEDAVVAGIEPPLPSAERDVFVWAVLRMAQGTALSPLVNSGRLTWTVPEWIAFMHTMPFPTVEARASEADFRALVRELTYTTGLCQVDADGVLSTCAPACVLRVCQDDSELAPMMIRLAASLVGRRVPVASPIVPWIGMFVYWISRRHGQPTTHFPRPRGAGERHADIDVLIGLTHAQTTIPASPFMLHATLVAAATRPPSSHANWAMVKDTAAEEFATLAVASAFAAFGVETEWYRWVPREDLGAALIAAGRYADAFAEIMNRMYGPAEPWTVQAQAQAEILAIACAMLSYDRGLAWDGSGGPLDNAYTHDALTPAAACAMIKVWHSLGTREDVIKALIDKDLMPRDFEHRLMGWQAVPGTPQLHWLIVDDWSATTAPPVPDGVGRYTRGRLDVTSD
jgi:hypothetical protein